MLQTKLTDEHFIKYLIILSSTLNCTFTDVLLATNI